jgi:hypothetical protein
MESGDLILLGGKERGQGLDARLPREEWRRGPGINRGKRPADAVEEAAGGGGGDGGFCGYFRARNGGEGIKPDSGGTGGWMMDK